MNRLTSRLSHGHHSWSQSQQSTGETTHYCYNCTCVFRSTMKSGAKRSRRRSSAGTTVSGWRWWTVRWTWLKTPSCTERMENPWLEMGLVYSVCSQLFSQSGVCGRGVSVLISLLVPPCADGIMEADGSVTPDFYLDFQHGDLLQTGYLSRCVSFSFTRNNSFGPVLCEQSMIISADTSVEPAEIRHLCRGLWFYIIDVKHSQPWV